MVSVAILGVQINADYYSISNRNGLGPANNSPTIARRGAIEPPPIDTPSRPTRTEPDANGTYYRQGQTYNINVKLEWKYVKAVWCFKEVNAQQWQDLVDLSSDHRFLYDTRLIWVRNRVRGAPLKDGNPPKPPFPAGIVVPKSAPMGPSRGWEWDNDWRGQASRHGRK